MSRKIGLIVNPVAGAGGTVGLKGTDHKVEEALALGGRPRGHARAVQFLQALRSSPSIYTAAGSMGEDACTAADVSAIVVFGASEPTSAQDTREAATALADAGVDVLVFVGGDGTAADVAAGVDGLGVPALGVPAGVKMYSACFADTPEAAASVVESFDATEMHEVLDIDEDAFRRGELRVALKGALRVPVHARVQAGKSAGDDDEVEAQTLGHAVAEHLEAGHTYVLGAGSTMLEAKTALGLEGTLLGLDVVWLDEEKRAHLVKKDATEKDILDLPMGFEIVVSPIGAQGFFLGRGNLPLSPEVLARVAIPEDILVVATPWKLLHTPALKVDTGDPRIDARFPSFLRVLTGHGQSKLMRLTR